MQRYPELFALKYQKMKKNEPFSDPQFDPSLQIS
jgi:hypothetical protein